MRSTTHRRAGKVFSGQLLLPNAPDMRTVPRPRNGPVAGGIVAYPLSAQVLGRLPGLQTRMLSKVRLNSRVSCHGRWQPPPRSGGRQLRPPGCSSCSQLCQRSVGLRPIAPPQPALPMEQSADCLPSPPRPTPGILRSGQFRLPSSTPPPTQRWKVRDGAIVSQLPGQVVPAGNRCASERSFQHLPGPPVCVWAGPLQYHLARFVPKGRPEQAK